VKNKTKKREWGEGGGEIEQNQTKKKKKNCTIFNQFDERKKTVN